MAWLSVAIRSVLAFEILPFVYSCSTYYFPVFSLSLVFSILSGWFCETPTKTKAHWCKFTVCNNWTELWLCSWLCRGIKGRVHTSEVISVLPLGCKTAVARIPQLSAIEHRRFRGLARIWWENLNNNNEVRL